MSLNTIAVRLPLLLATAACTIAAVPTASAQVFADQVAQGPGVCQAALPSFEGQIRKRPLAIQNEGTATAFVTCSMPQFTDPGLNDPSLGVQLNFVNSSNGALTVNCTGVSFTNTVNYVARTLSVPANTPATGIMDAPALAWDESDNDGSGSYTTISCSLPPGTGISFVTAAGGEVSTPAAAATSTPRASVR